MFIPLKMVLIGIDPFDICWSMKESTVDRSPLCPVDRVQKLRKLQELQPGAVAVRCFLDIFMGCFWNVFLGFLCHFLEFKCGKSPSKTKYAKKKPFTAGKIYFTY